jgi:SAM-dependent methyltransferase
VLGADFHSDPPPELADRPYKGFADLGSERADLAIAMHVLEHDDDPQALLARMSSLVRPGGKLLIEVPNIDCFWTPFFGRYWDAWYLPYHRVHYSRASLHALLISCGFAIERESDARVPTMGRTFANLLGRRNSLAFILLGAALHPLQLLGEWASGKPSALQVLVRVRG